MQMAVFRPLRLHAGIPVISATLGFVAVGTGSVYATRTYKFIRKNYPELKDSVAAGNWTKLRDQMLDASLSTPTTTTASSRDNPGSKTLAQIWTAELNAAKSQAAVLADLARHPSMSGYLLLMYNQRENLIYAFSGCVVFALLGGRFKSVLPSHIFRPGKLSLTHVSVVSCFLLFAFFFLLWSKYCTKR
jgi:hypothetical protein